MNDTAARFAERLRIPVEALEAFARFYNENYAAYGNEIYARVETRVTHWTNFLAGSWFNHRLDLAFALAGRADVVVDLGFSVPHYYASREFLSGDRPTFVFADKEPSAIRFYDLLVEADAFRHAAGRDRVLLADVQAEEDQERILETVRELKPASLLVVATEVLEHLEFPDRAWRLMERLERLCPGGRARSTVSLPVGRKVPSHTLEFHDVESVERYVARRMEITDRQILLPPPHAEPNPFLVASFCAAGRVARAPRGHAPATDAT